MPRSKRPLFTDDGELDLDALILDNLNYLAKQWPLPKRFKATLDKSITESISGITFKGGYVVRDKRTGRETKITKMEYRSVQKALNALFPDR